MLHQLTAPPPRGQCVLFPDKSADQIRTEPPDGLALAALIRIAAVHSDGVVSAAAVAYRMYKGAIDSWQIGQAERALSNLARLGFCEEAGRPFETSSGQVVKSFRPTMGIRAVRQ